MKLLPLILALIVLPLFVGAQEGFVLNLQNDIDSRVPLGEHEVTVQVMDDDGVLYDVDSLTCEVINPFRVKETIVFHRQSLGTYTAILDINIANIYYLTFSPEKPGFQFTGLEDEVHGNTTITLLNWETYILPAALLIVVVGGWYLLVKKR